MFLLAANYLVILLPPMYTMSFKKNTNSVTLKHCTLCFKMKCKEYKNKQKKDESMVKHKEKNRKQILRTGCFATYSWNKRHLLPSYLAQLLNHKCPIEIFAHHLEECYEQLEGRQAGIKPPPPQFFLCFSISRAPFFFL